MPGQPIRLFDPRHTWHVQGFSGRAGTTTIHDGTEASRSISGIFQAAEDFAVLCHHNGYHYFNHLSLKPLPHANPSGVKLESDIAYDHTLDDAVRLDASKYPSNSWDSVPFVTGAGDIHEVKLLDHAAAIGAAETPASLRLELTAEAPDEGLDYWHRWFRDTRYTVAHTNRIVETQLAQDVEGGEMWLYVGCAAGFRAGDWVDIERTATSEELVFVLEVDEAQNRLPAYVTIGHLAGS